MNYTLRNLVVASLLMLLGIVAVISFIRGERQDLSRGKQEVQVLVAAKDIPEGTPATELEAGGFLETKDVLREDAPPQAVGKIDTLTKDKLVSNETVFQGEIITLTAFDETAGLKPTAQIKGNERLFTVPIEPSNDAAGLIRAGDHVDIFSFISAQGTTAVVARDVEVVETPETLRPKSVEAEESAPEADGDRKLYVLLATDREALNIKFALAHSGNSAEQHLMFLVRPSNGDAETALPPMVATDPEPQPAIPSNPGPDPSVR